MRPKLIEGSISYRISKQHLMIITQNGKYSIKSNNVQKIWEILKYLDGKKDLPSIARLSKSNVRVVKQFCDSLIKEQLILSNPRHINKKRVSSLKLLILGNPVWNTTLIETLIKSGIKEIIVPNSERIRYKKIKNSVFFIPKEDEEILQNEKIDVVIFSSNNKSFTKYKKINEICVKNNIRFLPLRINRMKFEIGPLVIPGITACYQCLLNRLKSNVPNLIEKSLIEINNKKILEVSTKITEPIISLISANAVNLILKSFDENIYDNFCQIDLTDNHTNIKSVLRAPNCSVCGHMRN